MPSWLGNSHTFQKEQGHPSASPALPWRDRRVCILDPFRSLMDVEFHQYPGPVCAQRRAPTHVWTSYKSVSILHTLLMPYCSQAPRCKPCRGAESLGDILDTQPFLHPGYYSSFPFFCPFLSFPCLPPSLPPSLSLVLSVSVSPPPPCNYNQHCR